LTRPFRHAGQSGFGYLALRVAEARVNTSQTRLARRSGFAPVAAPSSRYISAKAKWCRRSGRCVDHAARQHEAALLRSRNGTAKTCDRRRGEGDCDNCAADLTAKIYFIATTAEYTPPVIYSLDERNKLVYLIQARPSRPDTLRVGQPISVFLILDASGGQAMSSAPHQARYRHQRRGLSKSFGGRESCTTFRCR